MILGVLAAWRLAPTRWGWAAAVSLAVLATPRLILYQLISLLAGLREPAPVPAPATSTAGVARIVGSGT